MLREKKWAHKKVILNDILVEEIDEYRRNLLYEEGVGQDSLDVEGLIAILDEILDLYEDAEYEDDEKDS